MTVQVVSEAPQPARRGRGAASKKAAGSTAAAGSGAASSSQASGCITLLVELMQQQEADLPSCSIAAVLEHELLCWGAALQGDGLAPPAAVSAAFSGIVKRLLQAVFPAKAQPVLHATALLALFKAGLPADDGQCGLALLERASAALNKVSLVQGIVLGSALLACLPFPCVYVVCNSEKTCQGCCYCPNCCRCLARQPMACSHEQGAGRQWMVAGSMRARCCWSSSRSGSARMQRPPRALLGAGSRMLRRLASWQAAQPGMLLPGSVLCSKQSWLWRRWNQPAAPQLLQPSLRSWPGCWACTAEMQQHTSYPCCCLAVCSRSAARWPAACFPGHLPVPQSCSSKQRMPPLRPAEPALAQRCSGQRCMGRRPRRAPPRATWCQHSSTLQRGTVCWRCCSTGAAMPLGLGQSTLHGQAGGAWQRPTWAACCSWASCLRRQGRQMRRCTPCERASDW